MPCFACQSMLYLFARAVLRCAWCALLCMHASLLLLNTSPAATPCPHNSIIPQMLVGYEVLLLMLVIPEVSSAFDFRLQWAGQGELAGPGWVAGIWLGATL